MSIDKGLDIKLAKNLGYFLHDAHHPICHLILFYRLLKIIHLAQLYLSA